MCLVLAACSGAATPEPAPPEAPEAEPSAKAASPAKTSKAAPKQAASPEAQKPPEPLPPGASQAGFPTVALVGFGLRFELNPPFQAARMANMLEEGNEHVLFVSWWDVNAEGAGQHGRAGLYNVGIVPHALPEGATEYTPVDVERNGKTTIALRLGDTGTELRLPAGISALGGMGVAKVGPNTDSWHIQVGDAEPIEWPDKQMLHSWDPADGGPVYFDKMPRKPFGPWQAPVPTPE